MSAHDGLHLVGCFALLMIVARFNWTRLTTILVVAGLGITWELLDLLNATLNLQLFFLDPRGFDIKDIVMDLAGIIFAVLILDSTKRFQ